MSFGWVKNWKQVLLKSWSMWMAFIGVVLPDLVSFVLEHINDFPLSDSTKNYARLASLALVIVLRPMHQEKLRKDQAAVEVLETVKEPTK